MNETPIFNTILGTAWMNEMAIVNAIKVSKRTVWMYETAIENGKFETDIDPTNVRFKSCRPDRQEEPQDWFFVLACAPACLSLVVCRSHRRCPEPVGLLRVGLLRFLAFGSRRAFALFSFRIASGICAFQL